MKGLHEEAVWDAAEQTWRGSLGLVIIEPDGDDFYDDLTEDDFRRSVTDNGMQDFPL